MFLTNLVHRRRLCKRRATSRWRERPGHRHCNWATAAAVRSRSYKRVAEQLEKRKEIKKFNTRLEVIKTGIFVLISGAAWWKSGKTESIPLVGGRTRAFFLLTLSLVLVVTGLSSDEQRWGSGGRPTDWDRLSWLLAALPAAPALRSLHRLSVSYSTGCDDDDEESAESCSSGWNV